MNSSHHFSTDHIWSKVPPFWPLRNLIAVNPLLGFDALPFDTALQQGHHYFQKKNIPEKMGIVNQVTIKWLQLFLDQGQATIKMPLRDHGFLKAICQLLPFDKKVIPTTQNSFFSTLPTAPEEIIEKSLAFLKISSEAHEEFLTLMLTTLPGWASYINYLNYWKNDQHVPREIDIPKDEYLAFRLLLTCLLWPEAKELFLWGQHESCSKEAEQTLQRVKTNEKNYRDNLVKKLSMQKEQEKLSPEAQLVFCIDVRSEPFRRALELQGNYETFGFAGFFGIPLSIENSLNGEHYSSCPVLLKAKHRITEFPTSQHQAWKEGYQKLSLFKKLYQSVKYSFTSPFALVETLGSLTGFWMFLKTFFPDVAHYLKKHSTGLFEVSSPIATIIDSISFEDKCNYAAGALRMIGLTQHFAPLVIFCGHGSETQNNTYASALECGACGGRPGAPNARALAAILNEPSVRKELLSQNITIPETTYFLGAQHNTTTDEVVIYEHHLPEIFSHHLPTLKRDLQLARAKNAQWRCEQLGRKYSLEKAPIHAILRSRDWAQVRPEWGLARNAAMVIGPRWLTKNLNLEGRTFLHSYNYKEDEKGALLTGILTAPLIVGYWINMQYFFSTLDNVAYGAGSKVTKNITGKMGVMQGNSSDLMNGLPLQSVYKNDKEPYHELLRLLAVVHAPQEIIDRIVQQTPILKKLFGNEWIKLVCMNPSNNKPYLLKKDFSWEAL
ncbi:MAG: DUF2309 domain-containing protein [Chthoniobacterales bacterium]|nr:DUF2309 domain-containing protein [Chthoniobacterales bacterium]